MVRTPHFVLPCRNCGAPLRATLKPDLALRTAFKLDIRCEGGCGIAEAIKIEPKLMVRR